MNNSQAQDLNLRHKLYRGFYKETKKYAKQILYSQRTVNLAKNISELNIIPELKCDLLTHRKYESDILIL